MGSNADEPVPSTMKAKADLLYADGDVAKAFNSTTVGHYFVEPDL